VPPVSGHMTDANVEGIWAAADAQVAAGRIPGYVAAVRIGGQVAARAAGRAAFGSDGPPMREDTLFRIASITKPMGAALALALVEDGALALDDPVARWLPEIADVRALEAPDAPLDRTVELSRPMTVRHLLTATCGWGVSLDDTPLQRAMRERDVAPGALTPQLSADEYVTRLAGLPLAFQPGEGWLYDTGMNLVGVVLARLTGRSVGDLLAERIAAPLGMADTGFWTTAVDRLATAYMPGADGELEVLDPPDGLWSAPPPIEELSGGLVSTAGDVLRFYCAMADGGAPVISGDSLALMTADALTDEQRRQALPFVDEGGSWGLGTGVDVEVARPWMAPGRWGWTGGTGTTAYVDPSRDAVCVLLTQRAMTGPLDRFDDFYAAVAAAAAG
jgi:CubicO group peptidase (beta-lactamase class C family)